MKEYIYTITPGRLEFILKKPALIRSRLLVFLSIIILAVPCSLLISKAEINTKFTICFLIISVLLFILFYEFTKKKPVVLQKINNGLFVNTENAGPIDSITAIIINEYISSDAITNLKTIQLVIDRDRINVIKGVRPNDSPEMVRLIKEFIGKNDLAVKEQFS